MRFLRRDFNSDFWSAALGREQVRYEGYEKYVGLEGPPAEVKMLLQDVDHPSRVHIDIETDDQEAEIERLAGLGAKEIARIRDWCVMEAPSGHRFCVVNPQRPDFEENAIAWE